MGDRERWRRKRSSRRFEVDDVTYLSRGTRYSILCLLCVLCVQSAPLITQTPQIYGFTARASATERSIERRFLALPSPDKARDAHAFLTAEPHVAGSPRDRALAEWVRDRWREYGLEQVAITEHDVLLSYATDVSVEMTLRQAQGEPVPWGASPGQLLRSRRRWIQEGDAESGWAVRTGEPHPARRHRVRLPRAGRSADAGMAVAAGRAAHRGTRRRVAAENHERAVVVERRA